MNINVIPALIVLTLALLAAVFGPRPGLFQASSATVSDFACDDVIAALQGITTFHNKHSPDRLDADAVRALSSCNTVDKRCPFAKISSRSLVITAIRLEIADALATNRSCSPEQLLTSIDGVLRRFGGTVTSPCSFDVDDVPDKLMYWVKSLLAWAAARSPSGVEKMTVTIVGAGPVGLLSAIHATREGE